MDNTVTEKQKKEWEQLFMNNFNCYAKEAKGVHPAITKDMFVHLLTLLHKEQLLTEEQKPEAVRDLIIAADRMRDRWSESDELVKKELWHNLHVAADNARGKREEQKPEALDLTIIRNMIVDKMPTGEVSAWDCIKAFKECIDYIDNYKGEQLQPQHSKESFEHFPEDNHLHSEMRTIWDERLKNNQREQLQPQQEAVEILKELVRLKTIKNYPDTTKQEFQKYLSDKEKAWEAAYKFLSEADKGEPKHPGFYNDAKGEDARHEAKEIEYEAKYGFNINKTQG